MFPKPAKGSVTKARRATSRKRKATERAIMHDVRLERVRCQIPGCPCTARGVAPQVAHRMHRGMGGNPTGDRTTPADLFLLCPRRHQGPTISLHAGTLRMIGDGAEAIPFVLCDALPAVVLDAISEGYKWWTNGRPWVRADAPIVARYLEMEWRWR